MIIIIPVKRRRATISKEGRAQQLETTRYERKTYTYPVDLKESTDNVRVLLSTVNKI
jgi:hypothetical protein